MSTWHAVGVGHVRTRERDLGDVEHRIEHRAAPGGGRTGVDDEHPRLGDDRELLGPVAVEHVMRRPVEHPAVGIAMRGNSAVHGGTGCLWVEAVAGQRGELSERREERGRIGGAAQLFQHDRQFDCVLRIRQLGPARVDVGLPQRCRIDTVLGDATDQGRRTLLGHRVPHGLLP